MTENKRFILKENGVIDDTQLNILLDGGEDKEDMVNLLNALNDENEQLKQSYTKLKHRHSLLHDECLDAECDRDSYQKDVSSLEKENEQLKEEIKDFQDLLANRENELLKPVWDKIYSEFENMVYAEKRAIINLLNECYDEIMKKELQE
jgi:cell division protein FtsB